MEKDVAEIFNVLNPNDNKDDYKKDNLDVVMLYVVDGGLSTDAAVMEVADELNKEMEGPGSELTTPRGTNNSTGENVYTYTGSVSADTITLDADHGQEHDLRGCRDRPQARLIEGNKTLLITNTGHHTVFDIRGWQV